MEIFLYLLVISFAFMYFLYYKRDKNPVLFPGDIYRLRAQRLIYVPTGSGLFITIVLYILIKIIF